MGDVLICDDAVAFAVLFERWMRDCGIDVIGSAKTAEHAVALAREHQPPVIVVDHLMPDSTSSQLAPQLREVAPHSKLLLISSMPVTDLARAAEEAGVDGHLSKAASPQEMCDAIRALLGGD